MKFLMLRWDKSTKGLFLFYFVWVVEHSVCYSGEQGMVDEAQKALEEAEALKKVCTYFN